nr:hypothetical protein [Paucibacter sp. PLA-PC-4]
MFFHVVTSNRGKDPLISHQMNDKGLRVPRILSIQDIPALAGKTGIAEPDDEKVSVALAYLVRQGRHRPAKTKTLVGEVRALLDPRLDETSTERLLDESE